MNEILIEKFLDFIVTVSSGLLISFLSINNFKGKISYLISPFKNINSIIDCKYIDFIDAIFYGINYIVTNGNVIDETCNGKYNQIISEKDEKFLRKFYKNKNLCDFNKEILDIKEIDDLKDIQILLISIKYLSESQEKYFKFLFYKWRLQRIARHVFINKIKVKDVYYIFNIDKK